MKQRSSAEALEMITRILNKYRGSFELKTDPTLGFYARLQLYMWRIPLMCHSEMGPSEAINKLLDECERTLDYNKTWDGT